MKINERSKFIINELIKRNTYVTASEIADLLQVSDRLYNEVRHLEK